MTRGVRCLTLLIAFINLVGTGLVMAESRYERWQADKPFTIGVMYYDLAFGTEWWKPVAAEYKPDPDASLMREAGVNLLDDVSMSAGGHEWYPGIRGARAAGIPFLILGGPWGNLEAFRERVGWLADEKDLYGVQLADEPHDPADQRLHRQQQEWIVQAHPRLLTLFCETLTDIPTWTQEWEAIQSDAIVYQWYPYYTSDAESPTVSAPVHACLARASEFCASRGIGFFVARGTARHMTESTLRLNTYAALAHGCDGFLDWKWGTTEPTGGYVWYKDNRCRGPSANFESLAAINREVAHLGPALLELRHVRAYHLDRPTHETWAGPIHDFREPDTLRTGKLKDVKGAHHPYGDPLMVGLFRDAGDEEYFMVVNKSDTRSPDVAHANLAQTVTLVFADDVSAIERLNRDTGKVEKLEMDDNAYTFNLPGGTGELFKYASDRAFAGLYAK